MKYLLDTCVLSDFGLGEGRTLERIKAAQPEDLAVSTITQMEIDYCLLANRSLSRRLRAVMEAILASMRLLPYDSRAARETARLRAVLKTRGTPIGAYDALIAGTALAHDLTLVTSNIREFQRIANLNLEDWRR